MTLQLLAEDPRKDGAAFLDLVQGQGLTVAREERTFRFPTFAELREARKANKRLLPDVTGLFRVGSPTAFGLESTLDELERAVRAGQIGRAHV